MAFFDRSSAKTPDELRDASQEELLEAVRFYKENKDKVPQISSELETTKQSLASIEAAHTETKSKLASLEQSVLEAQKQRHTGPPKEPDAPADFFEDPEKAFAQRQQPRDTLMLNTAAQVAQMGFEGSLLNEPGRFGDDPKVYKKYQKEVLELMKKEPLVNQASPQVWKNAFLLVKGYHADEIHDARKSDDRAFFGETPKPAVSSDTKPKDEVTDADRDAAKKYGISPEEVLASRKQIKIMPVEA